jgi:hypothetical protein
MKTSIFHLLSLLLVACFAASCGKESVSSGGQTVSPYSNPNAVVIQKQLKSWYASSAESQNIGSLGDFVKSTSAVSSSSGGFQASFNLCLGGLINIGNCTAQAAVLPTGCYYKNYANNRYTVSTPIISGSSVTGCTPSSTLYSKASNSALNKAVNGGGLVLINASKSGSVYYMYYGPQGSFQPTTLYIVDTGLHSLLNPVVIQENNQKTELKNFSIRQY